MKNFLLWCLLIAAFDAPFVLLYYAIKIKPPNSCSCCHEEQTIAADLEARDDEKSGNCKD